MITEDNWIDFIDAFFNNTGGSKEWIKHVANNWNHVKNEPGCACEIKYDVFYTCHGYQEILEAQKQFDQQLGDHL